MEAKIKQIKYKPTHHTGDREIEREKESKRPAGSVVCLPAQAILNQTLQITVKASLLKHGCKEMTWNQILNWTRIWFKKKNS